MPKLNAGVVDVLPAPKLKDGAGGLSFVEAPNVNALEIAGVGAAVELAPNVDSADTEAPKEGGAAVPKVEVAGGTELLLNEDMRPNAGGLFDAV